MNLLRRILDRARNDKKRSRALRKRLFEVNSSYNQVLLRYLQVKFNVQPPTDVVIDTTDKDIHDYSRSYSIATNDR